MSQKNVYCMMDIQVWSLGENYDVNFLKEHLEPEGEDDPLGAGIAEMLHASESDMAEADWDCHHPRSNSMSLDTVVKIFYCLVAPT